MSQHDHDMAALPLTKPQLAVITAACSQHHVSRFYLFGSLLRPDYRPSQSDIDLLVEFQPLEPSELVDAYFGLEE
jgi:predicted nucleotidyltransferase